MKVKDFNIDNYKLEGYWGFVDGDKFSWIKVSILKVMLIFGYVNDSCCVKIVSNVCFLDILFVYE